MEWLCGKLAVAGVLDPQTCANTAKFTDAVDMAKFSEVLLVFALGDMAAEAIDCGAYECDTSGGTYTAIAGKRATQLAAHASNNDNKQMVISVKGEELSSGNRYVRGRVVTGGATGGPACVLALGLGRYRPSSDDDGADVVQIVK